MSRIPAIVSAAIFVVTAIPGCRNDGPLTSLTFDEKPDIAPVTGVLETAVTVAYGASVATAIVSGGQVPGVRSVTSCGGYPCNALVYIDLAETADSPFPDGASGEIMVASHWPSGNVALMAIALVDAVAGGVSFDFSDVAMVPVTKNDSGLVVAYVSQSVNLGYGGVFEIGGSGEDMTIAFVGDTALAGAINVSQSGWVITVNVQNSWDNPADDNISITGADQAAGVSAGASSASIMQVVLVNVNFSASCRKNPVSGVAGIGGLGAGITPSDISQATCVLSFHSACDGTADVTVATGSSLAWVGRTIELNLFE